MKGENKLPSYNTEKLKILLRVDRVQSAKLTFYFLLKGLLQIFLLTQRDHIEKMTATDAVHRTTLCSFKNDTLYLYKPTMLCITVPRCCEKTKPKKIYRLAGLFGFYMPHKKNIT